MMLDMDTLECRRLSWDLPLYIQVCHNWTPRLQSDMEILSYSAAFFYYHFPIQKALCRSKSSSSSSSRYNVRCPCFYGLDGFYTVYLSRSGCVQFKSKKIRRRFEIFWLATSRRLQQLPHAPLRVDTDFVTSSAEVRDRGILLNSNMSMRAHVRKTVSMCFAVLRQLRSIRRSVSRRWFSHWWRHLSAVVWTTVTQHWSIFLNLFFGGFSQWWMQLV